MSEHGKKPELTKAQRRELQDRQRAAKAGTRKPAAVAPPQIAVAPSIGPLSLFKHLDPPKSARPSHERESIHPSVLRLALAYADLTIVGANSRCLAMLAAFKDVIRDYQSPPGATLPRHLPTHLSPQISHLTRARPMAVSMGNAIRYLKWEITQLPPDMHEEAAKKQLCDAIDHFIRDRIHLAARVIQGHAVAKIHDGEVILVYANSSLIRGILLAAKAAGRQFSVIVVDSRPLLEGKKLLQILLQHKIPATYLLLSSLGTVLSTASLVLLGTSAINSNGALYARAGTATICMMAKHTGVPVVTCCETYKFSDRIMLDSIVGNELGTTASMMTSPVPPESAQNLDLCHFLYDVTRPEDVSAVITEAAVIPVQSVPVVLREYKPINLGL